MIYSVHYIFSGVNILNVNHKLIVFGITGGCPALSLVTNFINHNGYYSCWLYFTKGEHINRKRQYRYGAIQLRTKSDYLKLSDKADRTQSNTYGHLGKSLLSNILDVELPHAIVLDYLHVFLLAHAKLIILSIYRQLKPIQREELNCELKNQVFPRKLFSQQLIMFIKICLTF